MTSRDFCFWLQGLFELANPQALTAEQTAAVKRHLALVFTHEIDPSMGDNAKQAILDALHAPPSPTSMPGTHPHDPPVYRC